MASETKEKSPAGATAHFQNFVYGLYDGSGVSFAHALTHASGLTTPDIAGAILRDGKIWGASVKVWFINLVLYGLPLLVVPRVLDLLIFGFLASRPGALGPHDDAAFAQGALVLRALYGIGFTVVFLLPMFVVSIVLTVQPLTSIADRTAALLTGRPPCAISVDVARSLLRIVLMNAALLLKMALGAVVGALAVRAVAVLPFGGALAAALEWGFLLADVAITVWLYAFYTLEMTTTTLTLEQRVEFFEQRWSYFFGMGLPFTLCTYALSLHWATVWYFVLSPAFVVVMVASLRARADAVRVAPVRLFAAPMAVAAMPSEWISVLFTKPTGLAAALSEAWARGVANAGLWMRRLERRETRAWGLTIAAAAAVILGGALATLRMSETVSHAES